MTRSWRTLLAIAANAAIALVCVGAPAATPAYATSGACTDNAGVTIVVDFQELGGGVSVACAPGPVATGIDALNRAGVSWEGTKRFPGFVCRIAGKPGPGSDPCNNTPPATAYWSYWLAPRGGRWCYSSFGAGNRKPPPGSVEGWSFSLHHIGDDVPPPRYAPPAPIPGTTPTQPRSGECTLPASSTPPVTSARPAAGSGGDGASDGGGSSRGGAQPGGATAYGGEGGLALGAATGGASSSARRRASARSSPSTTSHGTGPTLSPEDHASDGATREADRHSRPGDNVAVNAVNAVDLGKDGRGGSGSPVAALATIAVVAALAAMAAVMTVRRRRAAGAAGELSGDSS